MYKFVLDADAAIKLAKAEMLELLAESSRCILPQKVYEEVLKGKEKMYEDAFKTESLVAASKIRVAEGGETEETAGLDIGESSALAVFKQEKADVIISDDRKFIAKLHTDKIPFMTPPEIIVWLAENGKITSDKGLEALEKIKLEVREEVYERAKNSLGGK